LTRLDGESEGVRGDVGCSALDWRDCYRDVCGLHSESKSQYHHIGLSGSEESPFPQDECDMDISLHVVEDFGLPPAEKATVRWSDQVNEESGDDKRYSMKREAIGLPSPPESVADGDNETIIRSKWDYNPGVSDQARRRRKQQRRKARTGILGNQLVKNGDRVSQVTYRVVSIPGDGGYLEDWIERLELITSGRNAGQYRPVGGQLVSGFGSW
jgi:hypothetical protein